MSAEDRVEMVALRMVLVDQARMLSGSRFKTDAVSAAQMLMSGVARLADDRDLMTLRRVHRPANRAPEQ